jgi:uncharacterized protein
MISQDRKQIFKDAPAAVANTGYNACHYSRAKFFNFDMEQGKIADYHRQRNLLAGEDFIVSLLKGLEHEVGDAAGWLCYQIGFEWGKQDAVLFQSWFKEFYNLTIETTNLAFALETWWWPFTVQGWGTWAPNLSGLESGFFYVDLFDSAVAKSLGYVGKPVCHLYSGLLAGFFSAAFHQNLCRFLVGSEQRIQAAEFWINSGAKAGEIADRFHAEEIPHEPELLIVTNANQNSSQPEILIQTGAA